MQAPAAGIWGGNPSVVVCQRLTPCVVRCLGGPDPFVCGRMVSCVLVAPRALLACLGHALSTEREEVMGLCLGDYVDVRVH
jgi:hypothetical protein